MRFEWIRRDGHPQDIWALYLIKDGRFVKDMGTLTRLPRAWRVLEHRVISTPDKYWLDGDLSLEDAQRAAKLFLCVGRQT
jgi:hypothetical protein